MRSHRAVIDDDVDRPQVQRWRHLSRAVLIARRLCPWRRMRWNGAGSLVGRARGLPLFSSVPVNSRGVHVAWATDSYSGGFGPGVPPLPIPNRAVKPGRADGTAPQCGRVGRRLPDEGVSATDVCCGDPLSFCPFVLFFFHPFVRSFHSFIHFILSSVHSFVHSCGGHFWRGLRGHFVV